MYQTTCHHTSRYIASLGIVCKTAKNISPDVRMSCPRDVLHYLQQLRLRQPCISSRKPKFLRISTVTSLALGTFELQHISHSLILVE